VGQDDEGKVSVGCIMQALLAKEGGPILREATDAVPIPSVRYDVYRGSLAGLHRHGGYSHVALPALGVGACTTTDPYVEDADDVFETGDFYYLATAEAPCGVEGITGFDSSGTERPAGGGCP
jgi:hypothetical protein